MSEKRYVAQVTARCRGSRRAIATAVVVLAVAPAERHRLCQYEAVPKLYSEHSRC